MYVTIPLELHPGDHGRYVEVRQEKEAAARLRPCPKSAVHGKPHVVSERDIPGVFTWQEDP